MSVNKRIKVAIIDYQMGNLFSVKNACDHVGFDALITSNRQNILRADAAILPGVGAFKKAMDNLGSLGLLSLIRDFIASGKPFMGICLGMQLLFGESEEFGVRSGLNVIEGRVVKFPSKTVQGEKVKVPHIGWSGVFCPPGNEVKWEQSPLGRVYPGDYMYFVHSFYPVPNDEKVILSVTNYREIAFCSSIIKDNVFATQFHPEKSAAVGLKIYSHWGSLIEKLMEHE